MGRWYSALEMRHLCRKWSRPQMRNLPARRKALYVRLSWKKDVSFVWQFIWQKIRNTSLLISTILLLTATPMISFSKISIRPIWVKNWKKSPIPDLMRPLTKNSRWKRANTKKLRNIMTVFLKELKRNPSQCQTWMEKLLKKVIWRRPWVWKKRPFFPIARSWVLPRIFYLQVCSASLWQNTPMQRIVCFPRFIMDETIPGLKTRSACW